MPTGYTYNVEDGTLTELNEFVWQCAKAMGAFVIMREEPSNAKIDINKLGEDGTYYKQKLKRAEEELEEFTKANKKDLQKQLNREYIGSLESYEKLVKKQS